MIRRWRNIVANGGLLAVGTAAAAARGGFGAQDQDGNRSWGGRRARNVIFFIGDGKNSSGARQQFIAPKGATRLYLATWDFFEWNNNAGYRNIRVKRPSQIILVK